MCEDVKQILMLCDQHNLITYILMKNQKFVRKKNLKKQKEVKTVVEDQQEKN